MRPVHAQHIENNTWQIGRLVLDNVHPQAQCEGRVCVMHSPTDHPMSVWPQLFRDTKGLVERTCPHGVGHPDPDSMAYFHAVGADYMGVHGCDGCCSVESITEALSISHEASDQIVE